MKPNFDLNKLNKELNVVYNYLRKLGIPHMDSQDIVQETAYKFLLYYDTIRTPKVRGWLIRVALNIFHDHYRKNKHILLGWEEDLITIYSKDSPEDILISNENWTLIQEILSKMKPRFRELIFLKYILNLNYQEISSLLDMKLNTVKTYLARARRDFICIYRRYKNEQEGSERN